MSTTGRVEVLPPEEETPRRRRRPLDPNEVGRRTARNAERVADGATTIGMALAFGLGAAAWGIGKGVFRSVSRAAQPLVERAQLALEEGDDYEDEVVEPRRRG